MITLAKCRKSGAILLLIGCAFWFAAPPVHAHEQRPVDEVEFVVGFTTEPAYEGIKNGVDLRVRVPGATEDAEPTPVEGVEDTLQVEITHVPTGISKTVPLRTIFRDPGHYTADLIPTAPGQYRFRFIGTVQESEVDETFESGPGRFGDVESAFELQFPNQVPEAREVEGAVRGIQQTTTELVDSVRTLQVLAIAGTLMGAIGLVMGAVALVVARRSQA